MRRLIKGFLRSSIVIFICAFVGYTQGSTIIGWILGIIVCLLLGYSDRYGREDWLLECSFQISFLLTYVSVFPLNILLVSLALINGIFITLFGVRNHLKLAGITIDQFLLEAIFGNLNEPQLITTPRNSVDKSVAKLPGPRPITVQPDTAVIMVRGERQTRISGPETFRSSRQEYVQKVYSLRPIHKNYEYNHILSKDLISTQVRISITYGIDVASEARLGERPLNLDEVDKIKRLNSWTDEWEIEIRSIVEQQIRYFLGQHELNDASDVTMQPEIEDNVSSHANEKTILRGIKIYDLHIISIQPDKTISNAREENWLTDTRSETLRKQEDARSKAWKAAIIDISEAYANAQSHQIPDGMIYRELLRRMLENVANDPKTRRLIPPELQKFLVTDEENEK